VVRRLKPMPGPDLVSVIVPMWNAGAWIDPCLKGILSQTHANLEVFCVDDCSDDDSYERVVSQFGADGRLCAVRLRRRVGSYQVKNWAIATMTRGRFIAMQDADDLSHPTRIAVQVRWMQEHGFRVSGTWVHQFSQDGTPLIYGTQPPLPRHGRFHNLVRYPTVSAVRGPDDYRSLFGDRRFSLAKHGSQVFESAVLREFGGFDGRTAISADLDVNLRLLRFMDLGNVPRVLYSRRIHAASLTRRPDTGYDSPARRAQRARYDEDHAEIARCLAAGDDQRGRALCVQDLFCGDVEVEEVHTGFDFEQSPQAPAEPASSGGPRQRTGSLPSSP
jgi:glycosyltransferase involved in cell wall biosynthesis